MKAQVKRLVLRLVREPSGIVLDYPPHPRPRYGWDTPTNPALTAIIAPGIDRYRTALESILAHREDLEKIEATPTSPTEPAWRNDFIPGLDAAALYTFVTDLRPTLYLEIGSGNSTRFVRRALRDHALPTRIVSVDPFPRAECDELCDEVIRQPVEDLDLALFDRLQAGDVMFIDNSHRVFQNSDATVMLTEVVPNLPAGVLVGIHDIFLPSDYPPEWVDRYYSEQYLLAAWLLGGGGGCEIVLPAHYIRSIPELDTLCDPIWSASQLAAVQRNGAAFWLRTG